MIKKIAATAAALAAATAGTLTLGAGNAQAADYQGQVTASGGLSVRYAPSTHASKVDQLKKGEHVGLGCWVKGTSVDGNRTWYAGQTDSPSAQWISGRYVKLLGKKPPRCSGDAAKGKATASLSVRQGPNSADKRIGSIGKSTTFGVICKQPGQSVAGNNRWYLTTDNGWVSARYVSNVGKTPQWCRWPN